MNIFTALTIRVSTVYTHYVTADEETTIICIQYCINVSENKLSIGQITVFYKTVVIKFISNKYLLGQKRQNK